MPIEQKYIDLIQAGLDGEISESEQATLDTFLANSPEGREYFDGMQAMFRRIAAVPSAEPPPHLHYVLRDSFKPGKRAVPRQEFTMRQLFAAPIFRHAVAFSAGVFMTLALVNSNQISDTAFDDVTGLVGTISDNNDAVSGHKTINVNKSEIAGTVSMRKAGSLTIVNFNLSAAGPVNIVAGFKKADLWFKGFAQLENDGASVSADPGEVKFHMQGRNRYAMYLQHAGQADAAVALRFYSAGKLVHEADLVLVGSASKPNKSGK